MFDNCCFHVELNLSRTSQLLKVVKQLFFDLNCRNKVQSNVAPAPFVASLQRDKNESDWMANKYTPKYAISNTLYH